MAISGALEVSSFAKNGTLGDQSGNGDDEITFDTAMTTNNGDCAGPPTDGTAAFPGRLVVIRKGDADEEIRYITEVVTGNQCKVHEDWISNPVSGDIYHIFYGTSDMDNGGGNNFKELLKRVTDWAASSTIVIQSGGGFALIDQHSIESVDNSSTTLADVEVESGGRFDIGYLGSGSPISGGMIVMTPAIDGELCLDVQSGGEINFHGLKVTSVKTTKSWWNGTCVLRSVQLYACTYNMDLRGSIDAEGLEIQGKGSTNENILVDASTVIVGGSLIATNGFQTDADTATQTITLREILFVGNARLFQISDNKTIELVDPYGFAPAITDQTDLDFTGTSYSGILNERYSVQATVQEADGTPINGALVAVYEHSQLLDLVVEAASDASGEVSESWVYKKYVDDGGTHTTVTVTTYGGHALRVDGWLYVPFVAAQTANTPFAGSITLISDSNIAQTTQATAKSVGTTAGVTWNEGTNPSSIISFTGGSGGTIGLAVGNTITGAGGADGIVTQIVSGDGTAGTIHLKTRDANDFVNGETINNGADGWTATYTASTQQDFAIWIDAQELSLQALYDYLASITSETTLTTDGELIHEWGRDSQGRALSLSGSLFSTERSYLKGVFVVDYGTGNVDHFTDDLGNTWTPPSQVTLKVYVEDQSGTAIIGARVAIYEDNAGVQGTELMNELTIAGTGGDSGKAVAEQAYTYSADQPVIIRVRKSSSGTKFIPIKTSGTITTSGVTLTVVVQQDTNTL